MKPTDFAEILENSTRGYLERFGTKIHKLISSLLKKILLTSRLNAFIHESGNMKGLNLIESFMDFIDFSYIISDKDKRKIPAEGKLIIVSNHPLGGLDGLALLKSIADVRKDVKILANSILAEISEISELLLPVQVFKNNQSRQQMDAIGKCLDKQEAVIIFPAGEVSRLSIAGIKDKKWTGSAVYFAGKYNAPVLPVYIKGRNSLLFYFVSIFLKPLSILMLPHEMFNKKGKLIKIMVGDVIPSSVFSSEIVNRKYMTKLLRKQTERVKYRKKAILKTEKTIIHPIDTKLVLSELLNSQVLYRNHDGKTVFLVDYNKSPHVIKEIARLREITFRRVGEGTGKSQDSDDFDRIYNHLVLWDEIALEIIGSYRIGICREILKNEGLSSIYNYGQFNFDDDFLKIMEQSLEFGRSFIQSKYWKTNALDMIWKAIAVYISGEPDIRYLWGAVSISDFYSEEAKSLIVFYYNKWYGSARFRTNARHRYIISKNRYNELCEIYTGETHEADFAILKGNLKSLGYSVPTLYRNYTELCSKGGTEFIDFGIDEAFSNSIDGLILLDLEMLEETKKERYFQNNKLVPAKF